MCEKLVRSEAAKIKMDIFERGEAMVCVCVCGVACVLRAIREPPRGAGR